MGISAALEGWKCAMLAVGIAGALLAGCAPGEDDEPVTGAGPADPTWNGTQSETAIVVIPPPPDPFPPPDPSPPPRIVVTYNDTTDNEDTLIYTEFTRTIFRGTSLLGWSYSLDEGASWTYGGKVRPPGGWAAIWGDPAITRASDGRVYISNLAVPESKYPESGISGPVNEYLGGACMARSDDGGLTFVLHNCVSKNDDFYDGGSMASTADGSVWASFVDVDTETIDVYRSFNGGPFTLVSGTPFPGMPVISHPRVRALRGSSLTPALYVAAMVAEQGPFGPFTLYMNRLVKDCAVCSFHWETPVHVADDIAIYPTVPLQNRTLRNGPQFSFDLTPGSAALSVDEVRFVATRSSPLGRLYLVAVQCPAGSSCSEVPDWGTELDAPASQFNPNLRVTSGEPRIWKLSYLATDGLAGTNNDVVVWQGNLANIGGVPLLTPQQLVGPHLVCSDLRGYWGDYDDLQVFSEGRTGESPRFVRAESDSDAGCEYRWQYTERHLHVSAVLFE